MSDARSFLFPEGRCRFTGMIFDFDGTIADSMEVWYWVDMDFLARRNLVPPDDYGKKLSTLGFDAAAAYVIDHFGLKERPEAIMDEWNELALEYYTTNVSLKPSVREFIQKIREMGVVTSIATTLTPLLLNAALENNDARDLFDCIAYGHEVEHDKHEPDVYLLAAERMGLEAAECVVFEDILPGVQSAKRAGMGTVAVRDDSGHQEVEALHREADTFLDGFRYLL